MSKNPRDPARLSLRKKDAILRGIQGRLWADCDEKGPFWNGNKQWDACEVLQEIASIMEECRPPCGDDEWGFNPDEHRIKEKP